jgi:hypothetical protein
MGSNRYDQRKHLEELEVNAIGTEYVRADFLPAANAARVVTLLASYLDQRVLFYETRDNLRYDRSMSPRFNSRAIYGPPSGLRRRRNRHR